MSLEETRTGRLIDALVEDLVPVRPARSLTATLLGWGAISLPWVLLPLLGHGGLRPDAGRALLSAGLPAWETIAGILAAAALSSAGLELGVPGARSARLSVPLPLVLTGVWIGLLLVGEPVIGEGPMPLGKRPHCFIESLGLATLPLALGLVAHSRRATRGHALAGSLMGGASACLPGLAMQLACMYDPAHALQYHLTPILPAAALGALLGAAVGALRAHRAPPVRAASGDTDPSGRRPSPDTGGSPCRAGSRSDDGRPGRASSS